jgi:hypothetical protein
MYNGIGGAVVTTAGLLLAVGLQTNALLDALGTSMPPECAVTTDDFEIVLRI